ncbi:MULTISPECIES: glycosyltransferase family 2 protein [Methylocaldum]|jgi:biofilm PGA synthesis N-glycosyltransferase PgaC|uniref:glycosyltransferase family 2 protein n=2 Tax=Methylocaldum TaxID=73778 RepID=UPI00098A1DC9|nr:glycosyltransferase family 2 protein [Methylocaldum sp. 14B]MBP1152024.1 cellulose synthase/poly-beta-1,6-N-acetylglucosamine synthase-like glycosyltransferase [Methylocaldum sp. RMAD-M]
MMLSIFWLCLGLICYVYIGYPILITALASVRQRRIDAAPIHPTVSLIVCAYNEEDIIGRKIENSLSLNYPAHLLEVIVVNDGSTDRTSSIISKYTDKPDITIVHSPVREGKAAAMNRAAALAKGEILIFSDARAIYRADSLKLLVRNFNDPEVGCVNGNRRLHKNRSPIFGSEKSYWGYEAYIKTKETQCGSTVSVSGAMLAIRASIFEPIPTNMILDDACLAMQTLRKGFRVIYDPAALCFQSSAMSTRDEVLRRQRITAGRFQMLLDARALWPWNDKLAIFELVSHKVMRLFLPFFSAGVFLSSAGLMFLPDTPEIVIALFWAQIAFGFLAVIGWISEKFGWKVGLLGIWYYIASGNFASFRGLVRYSKGRQTVLWEKARRTE